MEKGKKLAEYVSETMICMITTEFLFVDTDFIVNVLKDG